MALEVVRFNQLVADHADQLRALVHQEERMLRDRYFLGTVARYGATREEAQRWFQKTAAEDQKATRTSGDMSFGIIDDTTSLPADALVGVVTATRGLPLRALRFPIPPRFAIGPLARDYGLDTPATNVTGWIRPVADARYSDESTLWAARESDIQRLALAHTAVVAQLQPDELPWTIEPVDTSYTNATLEALEVAGFRETGERPARYDVGESGRVVPPRSLVLVHGPFADIS